MCKFCTKTYDRDLGVEPANFLRKDFYVDDGLKSVPTIAEAVRLIRLIKEMCRREALIYTNSHRMKRK